MKNRRTQPAFFWSGQICRIVGALPWLGDSFEDVIIDTALQTFRHEEAPAVEHCLTCGLPLRNVSELALPHGCPIRFGRRSPHCVPDTQR